MEKPVNLRESTWRWLLDSIGDQPLKRRDEIINKPGPWLLSRGLLDRSDMLQNTVIEQNPEDGPECLIDELAAVALSLGIDRVTVFRLGDNKPVVMTREEIITSLREGGIFDQINRPPV